MFNIADTEKIQSENTSLPFDWIFPAPRWSSIACGTIFTHRDPSNRLGVLRPGSKEVQEHIKKRGWQAFYHLLQRRDQSCKGAPGISR